MEGLFIFSDGTPARLSVCGLRGGDSFFFFFFLRNKELFLKLRLWTAKVFYLLFLFLIKAFVITVLVFALQFYFFLPLGQPLPSQESTVHRNGQ